MIPEDSNQLTKPVQEVAYGDLHKKILSGVSKEELIECYNKWSSTYDVQCAQDEATHKRISAEALVEHISNPKGTLRLLDAACGTGLPASHVKQLAGVRNISIDMVGLDFSRDMLAAARKKGLYSQLVEADLNEVLPFPENHFDLFLAVGLFLDGHCSPDVLQHIGRCIKPGGIGVITVRRRTFQVREKKYLLSFKSAGFFVVKNFIEKYLSGGVEGNYIVLQKE